jgi:hypothetical protein
MGADFPSRASFDARVIEVSYALAADCSPINMPMRLVAGLTQSKFQMTWLSARMKRNGAQQATRINEPISVAIFRQARSSTRVGRLRNESFACRYPLATDKAS